MDVIIPPTMGAAIGFITSDPGSGVLRVDEGTGTAAGHIAAGTGGVKEEPIEG